MSSPFARPRARSTATLSQTVRSQDATLAVTDVTLVDARGASPGSTVLIDGRRIVIRGDRELAIEHYRRSLDLDPGNDNAREKLAELGAEAPSGGS